MPFMYLNFVTTLHPNPNFVTTLLCAFTFCGGFQHYYFSFRFRNGKKNLLKLECAVKNYLKEAVFEILENPFLQNCYCLRF